MLHLNLSEKLKNVFAQNHGARIGEAAIVSRQVHGNDAENPGIIKVYTDLDAGRIYRKAEDDGQYLHMDVFYKPGNFNLEFLATRIWEKLREYLSEYRQQMSTELSNDEWTRLAINIASDIFITTTAGEGTLYELASRRITPPTTKVNSHIHFIISLPEELYGLLVYLANGTEKALRRQDLEIRKVEGIRNCQREEMEQEDNKGSLGVALPLPAFMAKMMKKHKQVMNVMSLANRLGSLKEVQDLLDHLTPAKSLFLGQLAKKHSDLPYIIDELVEMKLAQKGKLFTTLTEEGKQFKDMINSREKEMSALVRKAIRKRPSYSHHTRRSTGWKAKKEISVNKRKVIPPPNESWLRNMALPETVINSVTRRFIRSGQIKIYPEDIRVFGRKDNIPVDTCLLIDCSGSMVGEKLRAVRFLAENLLLSTRDKVAVVTFQNLEARVAVPFTNKYQELQKGLYTIVPGGLTPMADGIMKSINLIKNSKAKNPLLVLITDGTPNYPLWGYDGVADAYKAAEIVAQEKIRLLTVGVVPNKRFMENLTEKGNGHLHILEDIHRQDLVQIVHQERQDYRATAY